LSERGKKKEFKEKRGRGDVPGLPDSPACTLAW